MPIDSRLLPLHPSVLQKIFSSSCPAENYDFSAMSGINKNYQPAIGKNIACLLRFLSPLFNANLALDLGTCYGYSAMVLADIVGHDGHVMSIEKDSDMVKMSRTNIHNSGYDGRIAVLEGDATELIKEMQGPFDLILLDIDKHLYKDILDDLIKLLNNDGYLIIDDIGFAARDFPHSLRHHNIHMTQFVGRLLKRKDIECIYIPVEDGIAICRKKNVIEDNQLSFFKEKKVEEENKVNPLDIPEIFNENDQIDDDHLSEGEKNG